MKSMTISMKFPAGVSVAALLLLASIDAQARSLVCESEDRTTHYCAADTRGGVHLSTQFSKASCRQGSSWGYDSRGVWVSNGCRAQFDLGDYRSSHGSSSDSAAAAALALGLIGAVAIASKHDDDRRRCYYRLTRCGRTVATIEAERLADLVRIAQAKRLVSGRISLPTGDH